MKILYSCLSKSWGGMEMVTINTIKRLLDKGITGELLCTTESRIHIEANNFGMMIYPVKAPGYFHPLATIRVALTIKKRNYDLIHTHASKDLWLLVPALKIVGSRAPLLLTKHVGSFISKKDVMHNWLYSRVDYAIAISNVIRQNLLNTTSLAEDKILLHYNGVDCTKFDPAKHDRNKVRNELNIADGDILIGMVGRFSVGKGHEEFITAAKTLNESHSNLKFIITGEASRGEDSYEAQIKKLANDMDLKNIIFTGFRDDIPNVIAAMDIFVIPSHSEAFGVALVEAMAMGKPSVCSNSDGILDIAVDGETGYLFEKKDADDLIDKIEMLINSPVKREEYGRAARKRVVEHFEFNKLIDELVNTYKQIIYQNNQIKDF
ncbi:MAG: glycosyltransferase family 4 protein [Ignavibacterium sp.]|nr:MAG: glycosyltransferase family 4 protein [Ignavibacterium sp.]